MLLDDYERLRERGVSGGGLGLGRAILIHKGMAVWIQSCADAVAVDECATLAPGDLVGTMRPGQESEVVAILAAMVTSMCVEAAR